MKKTFRFLALVMAGLLSISLWSCSDDDKDSPVDSKDLPQLAQSFISSHYPGTTITSVFVDKDHNKTEFDVMLSNGHELTFTPEGEWEDVDAPVGEKVPDSIIPEAILSYVKSSYPQSFINEISKETYGFEIELNNGLDLHFNPDGAFLGIGN